MSEKRHYYLVSGRVQFLLTQEEEPALMTMDLNSMVLSDVPYISVKRLGKTQQGLQMLAAQKINRPDINFQNVIITGLSYLGEMTEEQFGATPPEVPDQPTDDEVVASAASQLN